MKDIIFNPDRFECEVETIISGLPYFVASVKGHIDEGYLNDYINFPPIIGKVKYNTSEDRIGEYMYKHMEKNNISRDKEECKLTHLLDTNNQFITKGMY
jgi:hypothetical protein